MLGYFGEMMRKETRQARATGLTRAPEPLSVQLRRAVGDYRRYRRALVRANRP